jgi:uncharacterized protein YciI
MFQVAILHMQDREQNAKHRPAHLAYVAELKAQGLVWAAGPFPDGEGGMVIYQAPSLEEARSLVERDPLITSGARRLELHPWDPERPVAALTAP